MLLVKCSLRVFRAAHTIQSEKQPYQAEQEDAGEAVAGQTLGADIHCHSSHTCPKRLCRSDCNSYAWAMRGIPEATP